MHLKSDFRNILSKTSPYYNIVDNCVAQVKFKRVIFSKEYLISMYPQSDFKFVNRCFCDDELCILNII